MDLAALPELEYKLDFKEAVNRWLAFWEHEMLDRPVCFLTAPREDVEPVPGPTLRDQMEGDLEQVAEQAVAAAGSIWWGGDAIPNWWPNFGPDIFAGFLGAELVVSPDSEYTSWPIVAIHDWDGDWPMSLDPAHYWFARMLEYVRLLAEKGRGKLIVSHLDMHSNLDAFLALRGGQDLSMDLMDRPGTIDRAMAEVRAMYAPVYEAIFEAGNMAATGTQGWTPAYYPGKTNTIQCDYAALIGPEHFRRWVLPALEEEAAYLGHSLYHLDGPEQIVHVPDLCSIPELQGIQYASGAGNKPFREWMDLFKEVQSYGRAMHLYGTPEDIKCFARELKPELCFFQCAAASQAEGEELLEWLVDNT